MSGPLVLPARSLVLHRVQLPLLHPMTSAHGTVSVRDVVLVEWRAHDGVIGWGECPTLPDASYSGESTDDAWAALAGGLASAALGGAVPDAPDNPMAAGALRDAGLDAALRSQGRSLVEHAGGSRRPLPMCRVAGIGDGGAELELGPGEALRKFKVTPETVGRLAEIRELHPSLPMAADANGSFPDAAALPDWLDDVALVYLEQPFPADDLAAHVALRAGSRTPVALDESLRDVAAIRRVIEAGAADVLSVKPARLGGAQAAIEALDLALASGTAAFVGGMLETGVGRATAAAVATHPGATLPTDLGPSARYFARDVVEPVLASDRGLLVREGPGIGVAPDPVMLHDITVERVELGLRSGG